MMIINCSADAAAHLYGKYKKGRDEGFFEPTSSVHDTVAERQEKLNVQDHTQWVVHAVKMGRSTSLIAMEFTTRWVHVIHRVRKGDVKGFIERLNNRLVNGIQWLGNQFSLFTVEDLVASAEGYFSQHSEIRFYLQTDRSAMMHINQVSAFYQDFYYSIGAFPEDEETALEFDLRLNNDWRCRKGEAFDLRVDEKMLIHWMTHYLSQKSQKSQQTEQILARIKEVRRDMFMSNADFPFNMAQLRGQ